MSRRSAGGAPAISRWALWSTPRSAQVFILFIDLVAAVSAVLATVLDPPRPGLAVLPLLICALVAVEGARSVERARRSTGALHKDLQAVWSLAAAIVLPPGLAVPAAVAMFAWWRVRAGRCRLFAWVFTAAMTALAVLLSGGAYRLLLATLRHAPVPDTVVAPLAVLAAAVLYEAVDVLVSAVAILLVSPGASRVEAFGDRTSAATDTAALTFGGLVAILYLFNPWAVLFAVPAVLLLQRVLLVGQLVDQVRTDAKTGLAVADWWNERTTALLDRTRARRGQLAVLVADLDYFKQINDLYGHLVGDQALRAVADAVRDAVRDRGMVGRFGGEEFVLALPDTGPEQAAALADQIRRRVAELVVPGSRDGSPVRGLTVSVGVAVHPDHGSSLDDLIRSADDAMYAAKAAGRNRVEVAPVLPLRASMFG